MAGEHGEKALGVLLGLSVLVVWMGFAGVNAAAAERVALVVGNAAYEQEAGTLKNPVNDATAVAAALRRLGFEVIEGRDLSEKDFYDRITAFDAAARSANVALFFYAGHGLQVDGRNYLAPVDLRLETKQDLKRGAIELATVLEVMRSETNLVILDACRNNPLAGELARSLGLSRAVAASRGLARVESASGTLIAYATEPGSVAADGTGDNSPYTAALLAHLETPGLSVNDLFTQVTASVLASTGNRQKPWTHASLSKIVRLAAVADAGPAIPVAGTCDREFDLEYWRSVKDSTNAADYEAYLATCPQGQFVRLARNRLQGLQRSDVPSPSPPVNPEAVEAGLSLGHRRLVQLGLLAAGFDVGKADGLFGDRTRAALRQWQASRGDTVTGYLDVASAKVLLASGEEREAQENARREAERRQEREPGERIRDCSACPEMVVVPAGSFLMGSPPGENGRNDDEGPQHRVEIGEAFAVGVYEVTFQEWDACVNGGYCNGYRPDDEGWGRGSRPVINVSWKDAQAYVRWLSRETGERYRLLSEAEWEYVARARTTEPFHTGSTISTDEANYDGSYTYKGVYRERTVPVGSFAANDFGLHDVHGNVWEWVEDCWNDSYRDAPADGRAWKRGECGRREVRGGSWISRPWNLRSANRNRNGSGDRIVVLGFRVSRTLTP